MTKGKGADDVRTCVENLSYSPPMVICFGYVTVGQHARGRGLARSRERPTGKAFMESKQKAMIRYHHA